MVKSEIIRLLEEVVGSEYVTTSPQIIIENSQDALKEVYPADAVVFPRTEDEISRIMRLANERRFFVTARGGGVGYTGGAVPIQGGIVLATSRLNQILEINKADLVVVTEPGVTNFALQKAVEAEGLFYPPDPASWKESFIGGNIAENAGGPRCAKYGATKQFVLGLDFVTPIGDIVRAGSRTTKNATGFNLAALMVGSEGMLGIITRCILRLLPLPETRQTSLATFATAEDACRVIASFGDAGIVPAAIELLDHASINAIEDYEPSGLPRAAGALLIIEVDGLREAVVREAQIVADACEKGGALTFRGATNEAEAVAIWEVRRKLSPAVRRTGVRKINEDVVVPRSRIPELLALIERIQEREGLLIPTFGHAGDGNLHVNVMLQRDDEEERQLGHRVVSEIFECAVTLGGTISGEHGIGYAKAPYLGIALNNATIELMKTLKGAMDPNGVLNPGKMFV